jgi:hypothetical protein
MNDIFLFFACYPVGIAIASAILWKVYRMGKNAAALEFMVKYLLIFNNSSRRGWTANDLLDELESRGIGAGYHNLYPFAQKLVNCLGRNRPFFLRRRK